jgi:hypothetical protein
MSFLSAFILGSVTLNRLINLKLAKYSIIVWGGFIYDKDGGGGCKTIMNLPLKKLENTCFLKELCNLS